MSDRQVPLSFSTDRRGQFITLGSILLAFLIIGGVYIGYVGFTSYEDRSGGVSKVEEVQSHSDEIADSFTATLTHVNHNGNIDNLESEFEDVVDGFNDQSGYEVDYMEMGDVRTAEGHRVSQTDPSLKLSEDSGETGNWEIGGGADDYRQFTIQIIPEEIEDGGASFEIEIENGGTDNVDVEFNRSVGAFGNVEVDVEDSTVCEIPVSDASEPVEIDLIGGKTDQGQQCELPIDSAVTSVVIENADETPGAFSAIMHSPASTTNSEEVVYSAEIDITTAQRGHSVTRTLYIAPGYPNLDEVEVDP